MTCCSGGSVGHYKACADPPWPAMVAIICGRCEMLEFAVDVHPNSLPQLIKAKQQRRQICLGSNLPHKWIILATRQEKRRTSLQSQEKLVAQQILQSQEKLEHEQITGKHSPITPWKAKRNWTTSAQTTGNPSPRTSCKAERNLGQAHNNWQP